MTKRHRRKIKDQLQQLFTAYLQDQGLDKRIKVVFGRIPGTTVGNIKENKDNTYTITLETNLSKINTKRGSVRYIFYQDKDIYDHYVHIFFHEIGHYRYGDITHHAWERQDFKKGVQEIVALFKEYGYGDIMPILRKPYNEILESMSSNAAHKGGIFSEAEVRCNEYTSKHYKDFIASNNLTI